MITPSPADAAHIIAKLLAHRPTRQDEIPELVAQVYAALCGVAAPPASVVAEAPLRAATPARAAPSRPRTRRRRAAVAEVAMEYVPPPPPTLLRRADVASAHGNGHAAGGVVMLTPPRGTLRGIVKWYDAKSGRGGLRLPGLSDDLIVEAATLAEAGIARLYKGQEIEATLKGPPDSPELERLTLPGTAATLPRTGVVRGRHAKPVVVELKRESLRRAAARVEAEQLLRPARPR